MFLFKKKQPIIVYAPISGEIINIENINDPVFSSKMLGDGFGIKPESSHNQLLTVKAPIAGTLVTAMDSGHAYGIVEATTKIECLVHVGIDTVELAGKGFKVKVIKDNPVTVQQPLVDVDLEVLKTEKKENITIVVFTKETMEPIHYQVKMLKFNKVIQGEPIAELFKVKKS